MDSTWNILRNTFTCLSGILHGKYYLLSIKKRDRLVTQKLKVPYCAKAHECYNITHVIIPIVFVQIICVKQNGKVAAGDGRSQVKNLPNGDTVEERHEIHNEQEQGENEDDDVDDDSDEPGDGDETTTAGHNRDAIMNGQKEIDVPFEENVWARVCFLVTAQKL